MSENRFRVEIKENPNWPIGHKFEGVVIDTKELDDREVAFPVGRTEEECLEQAQVEINAIRRREKAEQEKKVYYFD